MRMQQFLLRRRFGSRVAFLTSTLLFTRRGKIFLFRLAFFLQRHFSDGIKNIDERHVAREKRSARKFRIFEGKDGVGGGRWEERRRRR